MAGKHLEGPWIGIRKYDGDWQWTVDFQKPEFFNWNKNEPSGDGVCGQIRKLLQYNWNDEPCTNIFSYICERNLVRISY